MTRRPGRGMSKSARTLPAAVLAALTLSLTAGASSAGAAEVIGQLAPGTPPAACGVGPSDFAQAAVSSGNSYVVPALVTESSVITSWRHNAAAGEGQTLKMKIWRVVSGLTYRVVGHDGPRDLTGGALNGFGTRIPVQPGDVLGINSQNAADVDNACNFSASGDPGPLGNFGDTADGAETTFITNVNNFRINAVAVLEPDADGDGFGDETQDQCPTDASTQGPCGGDGGGGGGGDAGGVPPEEGGPSNDFSFGKVKKNKRKGTAKLTVNVPGGGELELAKTKKVKADEESPEAAGKEKLSIKPKGKAKKKLNSKGKAKVKANVTYTPDGGTPNTEDKKIKLVKR